MWIKAGATWAIVLRFGENRALWVWVLNVAAVLRLCGRTAALLRTKTGSDRNGDPELFQDEVARCSNPTRISPFFTRQWSGAKTRPALSILDQMEETWGKDPRRRCITVKSGGNAQLWATQKLIHISSWDSETLESWNVMRWLRCERRLNCGTKERRTTENKSKRQDEDMSNLTNEQTLNILF